MAGVQQQPASHYCWCQFYVFRLSMHIPFQQAAAADVQFVVDWCIYLLTFFGAPVLNIWSHLLHHTTGGSGRNQ
jgi:hypothetical protein